MIPRYVSNRDKEIEYFNDEDKDFGVVDYDKYNRDPYDPYYLDYLEDIKYNTAELFQQNYDLRSRVGELEYALEQLANIVRSVILRQKLDEKDK